MSTEVNKKIARRSTDEIWNEGNLDVVDEIVAARTGTPRAGTLVEAAFDLGEAGLGVRPFVAQKDPHANGRAGLGQGALECGRGLPGAE